MLEYFAEILSILISMVILKNIENYFKSRNFEDNSVLKWIFEFVYWGICFVVMILILAITWVIFGFETLGNIESAIFLSSINGFSSRVFGYTEFWILVLLTIYFGIMYAGIIGVILSVAVFVFTNYCGELLDITDNMKKFKFLILKLKANIVKSK
ncbi:MAG: hypothetical protein PWP15_1324 [Methanothermococcus sp.]|jgi:hypothetical protein|uniref:hypothetical protein n=1 Tax=Methanothermococcus TaxID=155862 RepID=UPI0003694378|nr:MULTISPECIES: hypothetical protein [Methanothermococcus]MDK2790815.1 hypothetical protein [Methanothermococcus sp.]MDK2988310.1 hypothetical protein [Methanothermococcus sp.]